MDYQLLNRTRNAGQTPSDFQFDAPKRDHVNNHRRDKCDHRGCDNTVRFRTTDGLCLACWTAQRHGEAVERRPSRGANLSGWNSGRKPHCSK